MSEDTKSKNENLDKKDGKVVNKVKSKGNVH